MRLDLRSVIHTPDAKKDFQLEIDLSHLDFFGQTPLQFRKEVLKDE